MTGSGGSLARSSSYEKGPHAQYGRPARRMRAARGTARRLARRALAGGAARRLRRRCRPTSARPTRCALPPNPESPLVKIAIGSSPSPEQTGVRLLPLGAYSLDARIQLAQRATTLARRPVLPARERLDRAAADDGAARREPARRARAPARRRPLHDRTRIRCCAAWRRSRTSRCASSTRSAATARAASAAATPRRSSTSAGSTTACTTSSSSPTA